MFRRADAVIAAVMWIAWGSPDARCEPAAIDDKLRARFNREAVEAWESMRSRRRTFKARRIGR